MINDALERLALSLPESPEAIAEAQRIRKPIAFENARRAKFWKGRLDHINAAKLDDPEEWAKIPIMDKDQLRELTTGSGPREAHQRVVLCELRLLVLGLRPGSASSLDVTRAEPGGLADGPGVT